MTRIDPVGERVQAAYADAPRNERLHVAGRLRSCPIAAVAEVTPSTGRVLDFGCGHGVVALYLAMTGPERRITGVDVDGDKIRDARTAATAAKVAIEFEEVAPDYRPTGEWDAITIVDVLYLLGETAVDEVIDAAASCLAPGGVLVIKEIDVRPRVKYWFAALQEVVATKVLRITEGGSMQFIPPERMVARLRQLGLRVEARGLHRGRLHPHHLIVARKDA